MKLITVNGERDHLNLHIWYKWQLNAEMNANRNSFGDDLLCALFRKISACSKERTVIRSSVTLKKIKISVILLNCN